MMGSLHESPYGARIYFLQAGAIFVRQCVLKGLTYQCKGWHGATAKAGADQAGEVMSLLALAREGKLPPCDGQGNPRLQVAEQI